MFIEQFDNRVLSIILLLLAINFQLRAQRGLKDSSINLSYFTVQYQFQMPGGDLKNRFGNNSTVGLAFNYKTKQKWLMGMQWNYIFGKTIKDTGIFNSIGATNPSGGPRLIIDKTGSLATTRTWERGWYSTIKVGRQLFSLGPNPNCGFVFMAGGGMLLHKIRIEDIGNNAPHLSKEYRKGYDRLSFGFSVSEFFGYQFFDNNRYFNFLIGIESVQAFTKNRRGYLYDQQRIDNQKRLDILNGIKVGFIIPIYSRTTDEYYFY